METGPLVGWGRLVGDRKEKKQLMKRKIFKRAGHPPALSPGKGSSERIVLYPIQLCGVENRLTGKAHG